MRKIKAIIVAVFGALLIALKLKNREIDVLKHDNKIHERKDEIEQAHKIDEAEILKNEKQRIQQKTETARSNNKRDRLNRL